MADPILIQSSEREVHTSSSGIEILRKFSFEPYDSHPAVLDALQGYVRKDDKGLWKRTLPARDPYIRSCYCNEARVELLDPASLTTSPDIQKAARAKLGVDPNVDPAGEMNGDPPGKETLRDILEVQKEDPRDGTGGGYITASYRPLITAWLKDKSPRMFDWIDPQFKPGFKQVKWPEGLVVKIEGRTGPFPLNVPDEIAEPISIPVIDFSIRRILVGEPPFYAAELLAGCVNKDIWPYPTADFTLPTFQKETLKFEGMDIENRLDSKGNQIFEIILHFSWINLQDMPVHDKDGKASDKLVSVTWNHIFMNPNPWGLTGDVYPTGWYYVQREKDVFLGPLKLGYIAGLFEIPATAGSLFTKSDFDRLFQHN